MPFNQTTSLKWSNPGSVLGPIFFIIYVNDIDCYIKNSKIVKYADDIRIYRCYKSDAHNQRDNAVSFQNNINGINSWSETWELKFNTSKCCVLYFGKSNIKSPYEINECLLKSKHQEKDLGILFSTNFRFNEHMDAMISKANRQLGIISRVFKQKNPETIIPLYKSFVRPFLEYNSIIWSPYTKTYIRKIERFQEKMCNLISGLRSLTYKEKLKKLKLHSLQARRIKQQLTFMFKMKYKLIDLCFNNFFHENKHRKTRGNSFKLKLQNKISSKLFYMFDC